MKQIKYMIALTTFFLGLGCATTTNLPTGAKKVGGGLHIDWDAPADGTAVLVETTTGKTVATKSVTDETGFTFDVSKHHDAEVLRTIFPTLPANAQFELYFVPSPKSD
jgi:hypothetical protein